MVRSRRQVCRSALALLATCVMPRVAAAARKAYELVRPGTCLAGDWGEPRPEWRLQLAVFTADDAPQRAEQYRAALADKGVAAEVYVAMWLVAGDDWDQMVVVSTQVFDGAAQAGAAARALQKRTVPAFARHYTRYVART